MSLIKATDALILPSLLVYVTPPRFALPATGYVSVQFLATTVSAVSSETVPLALKLHRRFSVKVEGLPPNHSHLLLANVIDGARD